MRKRAILDLCYCAQFFHMKIKLTLDDKTYVLEPEVLIRERGWKIEEKWFQKKPQQYKIGYKYIYITTSSRGMYIKRKCGYAI